MSKKVYNYIKLGGEVVKKIIEMFIAFFKIGAFTFGGGYAMIPLIEEEVVNNKKWIEKDEFMDILVVSSVILENFYEH